ncbi:hypothetical protein V502_06397 [Pseudogymnoascus sp. VKM F-4520 (FW-2644)]|nr:hypothetical protein V502_06397 [Pseudogymnoascus sp. VKM F-4520 (FW-2644)]
MDTTQPPPSLAPSPTTTMEQSAPTENQQASLSAQSDKEEENLDVDPEILAMLEEANQAFKEGLEEQAACDREAELDDDEALDREFELAFATLDEEEPGWDDPVWSDRSGACSPASVRSFGFGPIPDEYRNYDDDARSEASDDSLFREKIPPVGSRPILKPKSRVRAARATPAEKAAAAMMPFTVSNPADIPAMSFPSNPSWGGAPIPSSGQQTLTFMGVTTSVPVLSDTANLELVNAVGATNMITECSNERDRALVGLAMKELKTATSELVAAGVRQASLEADVRRLEEDRKSMGLQVADLEARLSEKLGSSAAAQMAATKELQVCRNALTASQQSCNAMNKENSELKRQVSELANAANNLDKESNDIRHQVSELANHVAFVNGELDTRTRERDFAVQKLGELDTRTQERDFAVQKLGEAQFHIDEAIAANNHHRQQIAIMESNAAAKEVEVNTLTTALTKAETERQDLESNAAAKQIELNTLTTALTKAETEKQDLESNAAAKEVELNTLMTALTKAESEKRDLELKAKEKEDDAKAKENENQVKPGDPPVKLTKTEQYWKDKYDAADERATVAETNSEAYEQDYFDMKGNYKLADIKISQLTDTVAEMKVEAQHKESNIFELTQDVQKLNVYLGELGKSTATERAGHYKEVEKLKKAYGALEGEKEYVGGLLNDANAKGNSLTKLAARNKKKIEELEEALRNEVDTTTGLLEQVKKERNSSKSALNVAQVANRHRAQHTFGFPRAPRNNNRLLIPTLDEQLAAWKEDDGSSERFMEDHRRMIKEYPLTPLKPSNKPKNSSTAAVGPSASHKKTSSSVSKGSSASGVGPQEEAASDFDDSSVTAVEPSVSSNDSVSEPEDGSDTGKEISKITYYKPDLDESKNVSSGDGRGPKNDIKYVEQLVYVDKEVIVDKIIEHTVHQARSPIWAFLYVYVDLWTIFAHHFPNFVTYIGRFHPANIAGSLSSGIPSKIVGLTRVDTSSGTATAKPKNIDVESQTKEPTAIDIESQAGDLTKVNAEPDTHPTVIHKLPPLWPNLLTAILQLLTLYLFYQSILILSQRHIWLSANELTRSAVARFWARDPGFLGIAGGRKLCFWIIQGTGYSFALPG